MTNKLIRVGSARYIPGTPYQPYRPAYSYQEPRTGYAVQPEGITSSGWYRVRVVVVNADGSLGYTEELRYDPNHRGTTSGGVYTYTVTVHVPEQPEVQATQTRRVDVPAAGWTSFAHSVQNVFATGSGTFKVGDDSLGVAVGFTSLALPRAGYSHITHGLLFTNGEVKNLRTGASYGDFVSSDEFQVRVYGGNVQFKKNGSSLATEASLYPPIPLYLGAAMYGSGDFVDEPELLAEYGGGAAVVLSALRTMSAEDAYAAGTALLPALIVSAGIHNKSAAVLPQLAVLAADHGYASSTISLQALVVDAYGGSLAIELNNRAEIGLMPLATTSLLLVGETGGATVVLDANFSTISADRPYAESRAVLPRLTSLSYVEPAGEAFMLETLPASALMSGYFEIGAIMQDGVQVGATLASSALLDALMNDTARVGSTWALSAIVEAVMYAFAHIGDTSGMDGVGGDTWVHNLESGGTTTYSGYEFSSYARLGDKYYGASLQGLYELDGDTDAGAPINASLNLGKRDGGGANKKTWLQCYLGMSAEGHLLVRVTAEGRTYTYRTRDWDPELQEQRVTFGKGLRSNYVTLELLNEGGADFEVDAVRFIVADLTRKI